MNALAITIALILARLFIILVKTIDSRLPKVGGHGGQAHSASIALSNPNPNVPAAANQGQGIPHHRLSEMREITDHAHTSVGGLLRVLHKLWKTITYRPVALPQANRGMMDRFADRFLLYWRNLKRESTLIFALIMLLATCILLFVLESVGSIFSSVLVVGSNFAISQAPGCGLYRPADNVSVLIETRKDVDQETEADAANYARLCYDEPEGVDGCNFFAKQNIAFKEYHNQPCPFSKDICPQDSSTTAYTLETEPFPASELGINAAEIYRIKRKTTCTPLNMNETFIRNETYDGISFKSYYYGTSKDSNGHYPYLWSNPVERMPSKFTGYDAMAFGLWDSSQRDWKPHPAFALRKHELLLLLLISSHNVLHLKPRDDPIFPTNSKKFLDVSDVETLVFTDASETAKALACLESTFLCVPNGTYCRPYLDGFPGVGDSWPIGTEPRTPQGEIALYFTYQVVASWNIFTSIRARLGSGLVASSRMSKALSLPLAAEHWKVESRRLFQTSLAGWSIVARDISRARWAREEGLENIFSQNSPEVDRELCSLFKFHANGWKNINVVGSATILGILLVILLVSFEVEEHIAVFVPTWKFLQRCWLYFEGVIWPWVMLNLAMLINKVSIQARSVRRWL